MADTKISALPASTVPLAGTEVLPIVQSSSTKQVSVANLTAGRAISATQLTLTAGNVIVASGQGIDFSATPGTGTSELLADYEEGTWTPTDLSGASLSFTTALGRYTKVGNQVTAWAWIQYPVTASTADNTIGGLPFTIANQTAIRGGFARGFSQTASVGGGILSPNTAYFVLVTTAGVNVTNATLSTLIVSFAVIYHVA